MLSRNNHKPRQIGSSPFQARSTQPWWPETRGIMKELMSVQVIGAVFLFWFSIGGFAYGISLIQMSKQHTREAKVHDYILDLK